MGTWPRTLLWLPLTLLIAASSLSLAQNRGFVVYHESEEDVLEIAFPNGEQVTKIPWDDIAGVQPDLFSERKGRLMFYRIGTCYQGSSRGQVVGYACIANVLGKSQPITFMLKIDHPSGEVAFYEVMVYREMVGHEVREGPFHDQFVGKSSKSKLYFAVDIQNLSGATLSAYHLRDAIRKLLALYENHLKPLPLIRN